ncbi:RNA-binding protein [Methylicorpusculum oleiharenae]|uniref:RNA recognition motif domain-containing protein n=1 Tax=Methylicorpusculum oleiharenae TaxID=1338687 RepID=UPI00135C6553|nr:RNA-binding protein [Methylicorpusculum oleiharenae]MCD2449288.1 RNA-binding protein [Methylicorpusculum oleiharenae]
MLVLLKRIPSDTSKYEISSFFGSALKGGFFAKRGYIHDIKIMMIKKNHKNTAFEFYGLVRVEPEPVGQRAIKQLNGKQINGKNIAVIEFYSRNWHNDPRLRRNHINLPFQDRRRNERRKHKFIIVEETTVDSHTNWDNITNRLF